MSLKLPTIDRMVHFLNQSNLIEGIKDIDYSEQRYQKQDEGHFGALLLSLHAGVNHEPLNVKMIKQWHRFLTTEQRDHTRDGIGDEEIGVIRGPSLPKNVRIGRHIPPDFKFVGLYMSNFFEDINKDLEKNYNKYKEDNEAFANFLGSYFLRFERIHPFADGNGRMGRLIANYLAKYCDKEISVFRSEMSSRNRYIEAHESAELMSAYMLERIREANPPKG